MLALEQPSSIWTLEDKLTCVISTDASLNCFADIVFGEYDAQNVSEAISAIYHFFVLLNASLMPKGMKTWLWE